MRTIEAGIELSDLSNPLGSTAFIVGLLCAAAVFLFIGIYELVTPDRKNRNTYAGISFILMIGMLVFIVIGWQDQPGADEASHRWNTKILSESYGVSINFDADNGLAQFPAPEEDLIIRTEDGEERDLEVEVSVNSENTEAIVRFNGERAMILVPIYEGSDDYIEYTWRGYYSSN